MDPVNTYLWSQFVTAVKGMMTIDADRSGVNTFTDAMIRQACIDLQSFIPQYQQCHETLYYSCDFALEGYASRAVKPPASRIYQIFHITNCGNGSCCRRIMDPYPWQDRFALVNGSVILNLPGQAGAYATGPVSWQPWGSAGFFSEGVYPDRYSLTFGGKVELNNKPKYTVDPEGYTFYVYPEVTGCHLVSMFWTGLKINFSALEWTPFDEPMAMAVSLFVKAMIAREINHDNESYLMYMGRGTPGEIGTYQSTRKRLYIDANEKKH